jgi:hypothetical protein
VPIMLMIDLCEIVGFRFSLPELCHLVGQNSDLFSLVQCMVANVIRKCSQTFVCEIKHRRFQVM